jgi:hypothetical protein
MPILIEWGNLVELSTVGIPILLASLLLAVLLHRSWRSGTREPEPSAGANEDLPTANLPPELLLAVFAALCFTALLVLLDTGQFESYVMPMSLPAGVGPWLLLALVSSCALGASILAASLLQLRLRLRHRFLEFALVGSAFGLVVVAAAPSSAPLAVVALAPIALLLGFVGAMLWRSSVTGRFPIGIRAVALTVLPLYLLAGTALLRIAELVMLAR